MNTTKKMGQKAINRVAQKRTPDKTLALRQLSILQQRAMGKGVQQIATAMGVHRTTIYRTMKPIVASDSEWQSTERDNIKSFLGMTNANIATNLEAGNLEAAKLVLKVLGILTDKLEVVGKVDPSDQQKRMIENMEKLLKLKIEGPKQEALPEKTKEIETQSQLDVEKTQTIEQMKDSIVHEMVKESKRVEPKQVEGKSQLEPDWEKIKPEDHKPGVVLPGKIVTQVQGECSCPKGIDGEPLGSFAINPVCPVHGDKKGEQDESIDKETVREKLEGSDGREGPKVENKEQDN